jgi:LuxR family maltose regulon positive regulatory protein
LSKFRPPRQFGILKRERLFTALDRLRSHPIVWIAGPAGAGKTALAASYAGARALPTTWYRMDRGDREPAVFLQRFAAAVSGAETGKAPGKARSRAKSQPGAPAAAF